VNHDSPPTSQSQDAKGQYFDTPFIGGVGEREDHDVPDPLARWAQGWGRGIFILHAV
jgi:hypothetical protein